MRLLSAVLAVLMSLLSPAAAQKRDIEILSKAEALQLFAMSRQQWEQNVAGAVAAGVATRTPPSSGMIGMQMKTPDGFVVTRLDYSKGDAKPLFIQVVSGYAPGQRQPVFTDALTQQMIADVQRQMAPEFEVIGHLERLHGGLAFFFIITERAAAPK